MGCHVMLRFYFHIRDKSALIPDNEGAVFSSFSEAHHEGIKLARRIAADMHVGGDSFRGLVIEITDSNGAVFENVALTDDHSDL
jgi:hypothetical protein